MKITRDMIVFLIILLLFAAAHFYVFNRLWNLVPPTAMWLRITILVVGLALTAAFFAGMAARGAGISIWLSSTLYRLGTAWIFVFFYLAILFLVGDGLRAVRLIPGTVMTANWLTLVVLTVALTLIFVAGNIIYHSKRRVEITLTAPTLTSPLERPLKIVAASDLHLGFGIGRGELARWVRMINRERPDVVLLAGDVIDTSTRPLWQGDFATELRRLDAPYGVFAVPGNHEFISGIDESARFLEHAGIIFLRDTTAVVAGGVAIIGRDDASNPERKSVASLLAQAGLFDDMTTILLDHQPLNLDQAADAGVDLQISGHTHRGQIWPATWITDAMFERSHGPHQKGRTRYWISSGLGIWGGKFRLGSRSEYLVITITQRCKKE